MSPYRLSLKRPHVTDQPLSGGDTVPGGADHDPEEGGRPNDDAGRSYPPHTPQAEEPGPVVAGGPASEGERSYPPPCRAHWRSRGRRSGPGCWRGRS